MGSVASHKEILMSPLPLGGVLVPVMREKGGHPHAYDNCRYNRVVFCSKYWS
jgi:hypothetical protein